jgi:protein-tyrosine-phosphatase
MLFLCTHNSARSQLAAALWTARTGGPASSAGTRPATRVHRGAVAAARRAGLSLTDAAPRSIGDIPAHAQVVTVCDLVHEELQAEPGWWHWSIADPVPAGDARAFDAVVTELDARIASVVERATEEGRSR